MEEVRPEFNSSLQYLWRISNLLWSAHTTCMDETTRSDELTILEQLEIELDPRMTSQERWESEILRRRARGLMSEPIREYFIFLNRLAHQKGLILPRGGVL